MNCVFESSSVFETIVSALKDTFTNVNLRFAPEGIFLSCPNENNVSMAVLNILASDITKYECEKQYVCGVNMKVFHTFLDCGQKDSSLTLTYEDNSDVLFISFSGPNSKAEFKMKLLNIESEEMNVGDMEFDSVIKIQSTEFSSICKKLAKIGDQVTLKTTKKSFTIQVQGDNGDASIVLKVPPKIVMIESKEKTQTKKENKFQLTVNNPCSVMFSLPQVNENTKTSISKYMDISISENAPMYLRYKLFKNSFFGIYIAPKLEE
jgi:proliferating cell nuclear antigen